MRSRKPQTLTTDAEAELRETSLQGAAASHLQEFAEKALLVDNERRIRKEIFDQIDSSEGLDPQKAAQAWIELRAGYKLVEQLKRVQRKGKTADSKLSASTQESQS